MGGSRYWPTKNCYSYLHSQFWGIQLKPELLVVPATSIIQYDCDGDVINFSDCNRPQIFDLGSLLPGTKGRLLVRAEYLRVPTFLEFNSQVAPLNDTVVTSQKGIGVSDSTPHSS